MLGGIGMNNMRMFKIVGVILSLVVGISVVGGLILLQFQGVRNAFGSYEDLQVFIIHEAGFVLIITGIILALLKKYKQGKVALLVGTLIIFIYSVISTQLFYGTLNTVTSNTMFILGVERLIGLNFILPENNFANIVSGGIFDIAIMAFGAYSISLIPWKNSRITANR